MLVSTLVFYLRDKLMKLSYSAPHVLSYSKSSDSPVHESLRPRSVLMALLTQQPHAHKRDYTITVERTLTDC